MEQIRIECALPVSLGLLVDGQYDTIHWRGADQTVASFFQVEGVPGSEFETRRIKEARSLVQRTNRLIRWYRMVTADSFAYECTLWKASPFRFYRGVSNDPWSDVLRIAPASPLLYGTPMVTGGTQALSAAVRESYSTGTEPPVSQLFLFDARQALDEGRFREAVLFSWSTIDATFSSKFDALVEERLTDEWGESRRFLKGIDFGMRHRMTVGMRLLTGKSFFNEPDNFWERLSTSYDRRNAIIHRGEVASEADAENAVRVAEDAVKLMSAFAEKAASE